jgi:aminodeoxychorismate synthase
LGWLEVRPCFIEDTAQLKMSSVNLGRRPKILYLDAYDSFTNNIIALVEKTIDADVIKCFIDTDFESILTGDEDIAKSHLDLATEPTKSNQHNVSKFMEYLKNFDAVIAGPGPGSAKCDNDVGLMKELWKLQEENLLPVLGICLGFQSMCLEFGADIRKLEEPRHGLNSVLLHNEKSIFKDVKSFAPTHYHSLQVIIGHRLQIQKAVRYPAEMWDTTKTCPELEPLAWDFDNKRNGAVLMGARHINKPFWGVQFHPESILTNKEGGEILLKNWWYEAQSFIKSKPRATHASSIPALPLDTSNTSAKKTACLDNFTPGELISLITKGDEDSILSQPPAFVHCQTLGDARGSISDIVEMLDIPQGEAIVLDSAPQLEIASSPPGTAQYSIIGLVIPGETLRIHYDTSSRMMQLRDGHNKVYREWRTSDFWEWIKEFMSRLQHMLRQSPEPPLTADDVPFWGGLMGYASYEAGLETIGVESEGKPSCPDVCFAYITRSIVLDQQTKILYLQSIRGEDDKAWLDKTWDQLYETINKSPETTPNGTPIPEENFFFMQDPSLETHSSSCEQFVADKEEYSASVSACQDRIADGQSYELCLTTTNEIHAPTPQICQQSTSEKNQHSWKLYKKLASRNLAPFSAYMRMHNVHILSSSPERYISWDRLQIAQCRPIKGTVAKKREVTEEDAHAILSSPKERAENVMIVDLVRHQLHGVYGSGNVYVRQFLEIEEYESVWQLVSVIEAFPGDYEEPPSDLWEDQPVFKPDDLAKPTNYLGFDAFVQSLPPGSMTGAPKKRSCEILKDIEGPCRRGIYSGVLGYFDIGGGGDFSVIIRTAIKIDDLSASTPSTEDVWTIGAGGAVTALSEPEAEFEEMLGKFKTTARAFGKDQRPSAAYMSEILHNVLRAREL